MKRADRIGKLCQLIKTACDNIAQAREVGIHLRYGQALFNALDKVRPDLSEQIAGGPIDPFYCEDDRDPKIFALCEWVVENW